MDEFEVNCILKPERVDAHEHITHIGHTVHQWRLSRSMAISHIESGRMAYYVVDKATGKRAYLAIVREHGKVPYLRAHLDGQWNDGLLELPACGALAER